MSEKKKHGYIRIILSFLVIFIGGMAIGSIIPLPFMNRLKTVVNVSTYASAESKISTVLEIMNQDWYFASEIDDDLETRLTNQALVGITTNDEDIHTSYMSQEEISAFTQSINRNFVGIGVQFTSIDDGMHLITRVLPNTPAENAGVQAGDIIHAVDGTIVDGMSASELKELVTGEEGTNVTIDFLREGKTITLKIQRGQVSATTYGKIRDDGIGYMQIVQFGETTANEVEQFLNEFKDAGVTKIIFDVRGDGGGYLDALESVTSLLLPEGVVCIQREYQGGIVIESKTKGNEITGFDEIVILVDDDTASAAEAFTIALKEQRNDVTIVGETTYGKGTVQVTKYFTDGSAIKYTNSKWLSPNGTWVNEVGITPDYEVSLHPFLYSYFESLNDEILYVDTVSDITKTTQLALDYLGYEVDHQDGYFSESTLLALQQYEADAEMEVKDYLDGDIYDAVISAGISKWQSDNPDDYQLNKAVELLND